MHTGKHLDAGAWGLTPDSATSLVADPEQVFRVLVPSALDSSSIIWKYHGFFLKKINESISVKHEEQFLCESKSL